MSKARLVITAVVVQGRSPSEVARTYGVARSWVYTLLARYREEGDAAFEPRSRRPHTSPNQTSAELTNLIYELREQLTTGGLDAGADTIKWHLKHNHQTEVSRATIYRTLRNAGLVKQEPKKRPKNSWIRFEAEQPNETWQSDFTHYPLADGTDTEILTWLDDHSRYALRITAHQPVTAQIVLNQFRQAIEEHGTPASTLTDNGMVYTVRFATGRGGGTGLEKELDTLSVTQKNSRPNHPTTCGKVERFQQTLKQWLRKQPQPTTLPDLQNLLNKFETIYNQQRPHRSLPHNATPAAVYNNRPKATPAKTTNNPHQRVRHDIVDTSGKITLRVGSKLHHIGIGRTHARTPIIALINNLDVTIINASTGEKLRQLTIDQTRDYQPTGKTRNPKKQQPEPP